MAAALIFGGFLLLSLLYRFCRFFYSFSIFAVCYATAGNAVWSQVDVGIGRQGAPSFSFYSRVGRPRDDDQVRLRHGDRLVLNPRHSAVRPTPYAAFIAQEGDRDDARQHDAVDTFYDVGLSAVRPCPPRPPGFAKMLARAPTAPAPATADLRPP